MAPRHFSRSIAMMAALQAIAKKATAFNIIETQSAVAAVGTYVSRGKGGRKVPRNKTGAHMANVRAARTKHNKAMRR